MSEVENISDQLQRIYDGDAVHGPALRKLLIDLSAEQAAAQPLPRTHSIWELVLHLAAWNDVFSRRLEGHPADEPEVGDFPPTGEASREAWAAALERLDQSHRRLLAHVSALSAARLQERTPGRDYSLRFMLEMAVRHYVYHTGQIALLRKAFVTD